MIEPVGYLIVGLFALGMAVSFLAADPHSPTSRALALFLGLLGLAFAMNIAADAQFFGESRVGWVRMFSLIEVAILAAAFEWILRIGHTQVSDRPPIGDRPLRIAQGLVCLYGLAGVLFPALRDEVWGVPWTLMLFRRPAFYLFATPFFLSLSVAGIRIGQLLRAQLDGAERLRLNALALATPFWCGRFFLPPAWTPVSLAIGEIIFLGGAIRYHVLQGQRGQFLARFLSPEVVHLVRRRGLASMMQQSRIELSAIACDLRGFTAFTERAAPEEIMKLLDDYYKTVSQAVSEFGGSINDFAGDGILALVGAPIAYRDHAQRAVATALEIRERMGAILSHWNDLGLDLGLGIGIASGFVSVGVIGGVQRLEYAAVGPAVNLAARLCSRAEAGQILADQRVVGAAGSGTQAYHFEKLETAELKGVARPVTIFAVMAGAAPALSGAGPAKPHS
jgi:adenylate cyclase